jgi:hypothetical protein
MLVDLRPHAATRDLWRATLLACEVLEWAAADPAPSADDLHGGVENGAFVVNYKKVKEALVAVLELGLDDRRALARAVAHDVRFHERPDDEETPFAFEFPLLETPARDRGKALLVEFYSTLLKAGFARLPEQRTRKLDLHAVERHYWQQNDRVCPGCLAPQRRPLDGPSQVDRDHFFPKSLYPALSVHPYNLTLLCPACNGRVKVDRDPLVPDVRPAQLDDRAAREARATAGALLDAYLPFIRSAQAEVEARIEPGEGEDEGAFRIGLAAEPCGPRSKARLHSLAWLFATEQVWSGLLNDLVYEKVVDRVKRRLDDVPGALETMAWDADRFRFRENTEFLLHAFAGWIRQDDARLRAFADECAKTAEEVGPDLIEEYGL